MADDRSQTIEGGQPTWYERNIDRMLDSLLKAGRRVMTRRAAEHEALMRNTTEDFEPPNCPYCGDDTDHECEKCGLRYVPGCTCLGFFGEDSNCPVHRDMSGG